MKPIIATFCALLVAVPASALILSQTGNEPAHDYGWPEGTVTVANLKSRAGWWEGPPFGGGEWQFLYRGNTESFTQALTNFAAIRAPALELVVHDGPAPECPFLTNSKTVAWTFTVWVPAKWESLHNSFEAYRTLGKDNPYLQKSVPAPRIDVYLSNIAGLDWKLIKPPSKIKLIDKRAGPADASAKPPISNASSPTKR